MDEEPTVPEMNPSKEISTIIPILESQSEEVEPPEEESDEAESDEEAAINSERLNHLLDVNHYLNLMPTQNPYPELHGPNVDIPQVYFDPGTNIRRSQTTVAKPVLKPAPAPARRGLQAKGGSRKEWINEAKRHAQNCVSNIEYNEVQFAKIELEKAISILKANVNH